MSSQQLYNQLILSGVIGSKGETYFELQGVKTVVRDSSIVGNVIQEWLKLFMDQTAISYRLKSNTQAFPDFLMDSLSDEIGLLEVKCFKKSPNFDVANFKAYARSLLTNAYRLDADYLIFEYEEVNDGIAIKRIWLKKVWEICTNSERSALKIQWKQGAAENIRPATWYAIKSKFKPFNTRLEFVEALKKVVDTNGSVAAIQQNWINNVKAKYLQQTGNNL